MAADKLLVTVHLDEDMKAALDEHYRRRVDAVIVEMDGLKRKHAITSSACAALVDLLQSALNQSDDLPWPFIKEQVGQRFAALMDQFERTHEESRA